MNKDTRNAIERATQRARKLLEEDFEAQLEGTFDVLKSGVVAPRAGAHLTPRQAFLRDRIVAAVEHKRAAGMKPTEAVADYLRDAAFTTLNRFVALKMLEARELVLECVTKGEQSAGYKEFCGLAPGVALLPESSGYRLYIESLFDELSTEVKVLFDRRDPASALWPRRQTFEALLGLLNGVELAEVWGEDETIGWVYQFFNSGDERKAMRDASQAPRNSRELAVRNQFFTPRYVVEFLTDNTLGRIWYEMRRGNTALRERCEYMVRFPNEIFLAGPDVTADGPAWLKDVAEGRFSSIPESFCWADSFKLAHFINGYELAPQLGLGECGPFANAKEDEARATGTWSGTAVELWLTLFYRHRGYRHSGNDPYGEDLASMDSLCAALRRALVVPAEGEVGAGVRLVAFRQEKDPRDIRVLDPACGSGHFLLYAFDLLVTMYEEAWREGPGPASEVTGRSLRDDYRDEVSLRAAIPGLILRHNLHGVDIDPRCAQIAQLALWMRAQRAFRDFGVARAERAAIRRANVVVAEPMPGDAEMVRAFAAALDPPLLGELFVKAVGEMRLAGELGLLLRIDEALRGAIELARKQYVERERELGKGYLPGFAPAAKQGELDLSGIDSQRFFERADELMLASLSQFVGQAIGTDGTRRRLFAEDAAQGLGLIEVARGRFDTVLMNPPFGDGTALAASSIKQGYGNSANDLFAAFIVRGLELVCRGGLLGAITSRTGYFAQSLAEWRKRIYGSGLYLLADLGEGVMDAAMVDAAAYCVGAHGEGAVIRLLVDLAKGAALRDAALKIRRGEAASNVFYFETKAAWPLTDAPLAYWMSRGVVAKMMRFPPFEPTVGAVRKGLRTGDNFRFVRAHWEVNPARIKTDGVNHDTASGWVPLVMTGASQPWFSPVYLVLNWHNGGRELRTHVLKYGSESRLIQAKDYYFRPGFSWTLRAARLFPYAIPPGCIFTGSRPMAFPSAEQDSAAVVALFASRTASAFLRGYAEMFARPKFLEGKLKLLPVPLIGDEATVALRRAFYDGVRLAQNEYRYFEPFLEFVAPRLSAEFDGSGGLSFARSALLPEHAESIVRELYGLSDEEGGHFERDLQEAVDLASSEVATRDDEDESDGSDAVVLRDSPRERGLRMLSYAVGILFGRWDVEAASIGAETEPHADSMALRAVPAGYLHSVKASDPRYPVSIWSDGVSVSDSGHPRDITEGVARVLKRLGVDAFGLTLLLGCTAGDLGREFASHFFQWHIQTYTLGRRKAPLYWELSIPCGRYAVWLYLHALTPDTLYTAQRDYVVPKLLHEERLLESHRADAGPHPNTADRKLLESQEVFVDELRAFAAELKLVTPLWTPHLDDGVVINAAPLWRLFPQHKSWQKELITIWRSLCDGDYDWSHMAMHLWPERVVPKCADDRSLAIAHDLEAILWLEDPTTHKWTKRATPTTPIADLVAARTSPAVKEALKNLLEAPTPGGATRKRAASSGKSTRTRTPKAK